MIFYLFRPIKILSWTINFSNSLPWILAMGCWTGAPLFSVLTEAAEGEVELEADVGEAKPAWLLESLRASKAHASLSCAWLPMLVAAIICKRCKGSSSLTADDVEAVFAHAKDLRPLRLWPRMQYDSRSELFLSVAGTDCQEADEAKS